MFCPWWPIFTQTPEFQTSKCVPLALATSASLKSHYTLTNCWVFPNPRNPWGWDCSRLSWMTAWIDKEELSLRLSCFGGLKTFTPKSDQFQLSLAASLEILHHTVWRYLLFIALLRWKMIIYYRFSLPHLYISLWKELGECTFWTWDWKG